MPPAPPETLPGSLPVSAGVAAALLALVVLLWGLSWPVMKLGLAHIPPLHFALARVALGGGAITAVAAMAGQLRWPARGDWPVVVSVGLLQMGGFMALISVGLQYVGTGRAAVLAYTTPLWVVPLAAIFLGERLSVGKAVGLALGLLGIGVLFAPVSMDWHDPRVLLGNGMLLLAAMLWAVLIVQVRGHRFSASPLALAPWQFLVAGLLLAPLAHGFEAQAQIGWSWTLLGVLLYTGVIASGFCFWAMLTVTRALPAVTTSLGALGVPAVGVVSATWLLGEPLSRATLAGLALVAAGIACVAVTRPRRLR